MKEAKATAEVDRSTAVTLIAGQERKPDPSAESERNRGAAESGERVLIFAPFGRDGALLQSALGQVDIATANSPDFQSFYEELGRGAGAVLLTMEALKEMRIERFE